MSGCCDNRSESKENEGDRSQGAQWHDDRCDQRVHPSQECGRDRESIVGDCERENHSRRQPMASAKREEFADPSEAASQKVKVRFVFQQAGVHRGCAATKGRVECQTVIGSVAEDEGRVCPARTDKGCLVVGGQSAKTPRFRQTELCSHRGPVRVRPRSPKRFHSRPVPAA